VQDQRNREIRLRRRPVGVPTTDDFEVAETRVLAPADGQVLVRNLYMSVDPYMRGLMVDRKSYAPPYQLGEVMTGGAVGEVKISRSPNFKPGDYVESNLGWREWALARESDLKKVDPSLGPLQSYLGVLGMPGLTAYVGLLRTAQLKDGERVFVSAAAGAVGSLACQIAKIKGCYVVGSAGSDEKCQYLTRELGVDRAINYRVTEDLNSALGELFPKGIDVYFENVGGKHLEAALNHMRLFGRIAVCGLIDQYNSAEAVRGPANFGLIIGRNVSVNGFIVPAHNDMAPQFLRDMAGWIKERKVSWRETVVEGIDNAPNAFIGLFSGENTGKMLVKLA